MSKTTVRLDLVSTSPIYNFIAQETLRTDGTFGERLYTPPQTFLILGGGGRFREDSLTFLYGFVDSIGNTLLGFEGRRN